MEFLDNNQNNLQVLQDFIPTTVVVYTTEVNEALERNNNIYTEKNKWTIEKKLELIQIEQQERKNGRQFMERMKQRWNQKYPESRLTKQNLRDNAVRFKKDKKLMNLLLVREEDISNDENEDQNVNNTIDNHEQQNITVLDTEQSQSQFEEREVDETDVAEGDKALCRKFKNYLNNISKVEENDFEGRSKLPKITQFNENEEKANRILDQHLQINKGVSQIVDAVYAMGLAICDELKVNPKKSTLGIQRKNQKNRRECKKDTRIKELRQWIARADNEIYRRKTRRKASNKEKKIIKNLKEQTQSKKLTNEELKQKKEEWLDVLRTEKVSLRVIQKRKKRIKNNTLFNSNQKILFAEKDKETIGELPEMEKFEEFWSNIWEKKETTPDKPWMNKIEGDIRMKVTEVLEIKITMNDLKESIKKRKNWSAPGLDGIQNFWWKKFSSTWQPMLNAMNEWLNDPETLPNWLLNGKTVLIPKTNRLDNVEDFRPITCLNTVYKIFTGLIGGHMKQHVVRNNLWDENQLGTKENVLGTVDLLLVDQCIMEEIKCHHRNAAVAYYDYKKAYDYVHHDWINRVIGWMELDIKVRKVISKMMSGWKTRLVITSEREQRKSRWIQFNQGFLQGDSFSPVGFCICEIPILMLIESSKGYRMGPPGARIVNKTHSLFLDDLKIYQETEEQLEVVNKILVQASGDTGARYGVKKCCKAVFRQGKLTETEGLTINGELTQVLDPIEGNTYKFLGLEQSAGVSREIVLKRIETLVKLEVEQIVTYELYD